MQFKTFIKKEIDGKEEFIADCKSDEAFILKAKQVLADEKVQLAELKKISTYEDAKEALISKGYIVIKEEPTLEDFRTMAELKRNQVVEKFLDKAEEHFNTSLSKIKIDKSSEWCEILYYQGNKKNSKEVKFNGYEQVTEEFLEKFRSLTSYIIAVLGFPEEWKDRITTTGVSICYKDDELMGMVITAQMEITGLNGPLNLNTPFIKFDSYCSSHDCTDAVVFNVQCENLLNEIFDHSKAYMKGDTRTKQLNLLAEGQ